MEKEFIPPPPPSSQGARNNNRNNHHRHKEGDRIITHTPHHRRCLLYNGVNYNMVNYNMVKKVVPKTNPLFPK